MKKPADPLDIYTDGSCIGNPGPGGWAAMSVRDGVPDEHCMAGAAAETTNNRMELMAVIAALESLPAGARATVYSDSQYVVLGITRWIIKWKSHGWKSNGKPVANRDLWERLDASRLTRAVEWRWVRGHAGNAFNEAADQAALHAACDEAGIDPATARQPVFVPVHYPRRRRSTRRRRAH